MGGKEFLRLTDGCELVFCTLDEAEVLVGTREPDLALARLTASYREVVLKLGPAGAAWARRARPRRRVPACPAAGEVVDTTGAGDAFAAAYLAAALDGATPDGADARLRGRRVAGDAGRYPAGQSRQPTLTLVRPFGAAAAAVYAAAKPRACGSVAK